MSVPIRLNIFTIIPSQNPDRPLTLSFMSNKHRWKEGIEIDLTAEEAFEMARIIRIAVDCVKFGTDPWPVKRSPPAP